LTLCYTLGPVLLTGHNIGSALARRNLTTSAWSVDDHFANNDFVEKVAAPYLNKQIAIVFDGFVLSAPTINPGITGRDVTISGLFSAAAARDLARRLS